MHPAVPSLSRRDTAGGTDTNSDRSGTDLTDSAGSHLRGRRIVGGLPYRIFFSFLGKAALCRQLAPLDLRRALDGKLSDGAAVAIPHTSQHSESNRTCCWLRTLWPVCQLSYRVIARANTGNDAVHCGDRKFRPLTRRNRNDAAGLHISLCPICFQGQSVRTVSRSDRF